MSAEAASHIPVHLKLDLSRSGGSSETPAAAHSAGSYKAPNSLESASGRPAKKKVNTKLFKTNLCRTFSRTGQCPYGHKCQFAHGEDELRPVPPEFDDPRNSPEQLSISSPVAVSSLFAGANHREITSPRVESLSLENVLSQKEKMSFAAVSQMKAAEVATNMRIAQLASPSAGVSSPRVALLNLSNAEAAVEKPIPEGARVDCDPKLYKTELCRSYSKDGVCRYGSKCQFAHGIEELRPAPHGASKIIKLKSPTVMSNDSSFASSPALTPSPLNLEVDTHIERIVVEDLGRMSLDESKQPSSPRQGGERVSSPRVKDTRVYKTELCQKFAEKGECPYGAKCQFAHGEKELRPRLPAGSNPPSTRKSFPDAIDIEDDKLADREQDEVNNESDRRSPDPKLYKTELCRSFNRTGYCRYGLKCQFAHGIHELRPSPRLFNAAMKIGIDISSSSPIKLNLAPFMAAQADLVSEADTKYTPSSPRNLSGSPVIGSPSPSNRMLKLALGMTAMPPAAEESKQVPAAGVSPRIRAIVADGGSALPKASPTARQVFSFPAPVSQSIIEDVSKLSRSGTPSSRSPKANSAPALPAN